MTIKIGTRGSPLAMAQALEVKTRLQAAHQLDESQIEIVVIKTSGDKIQDRPLAEIGGKGLFTKEIEEALLDRRIDLAVHSMKDVPTVLPAELSIAALLPREDVRDALLSRRVKSIADLPAGAIVGTSSLRRQAQLKRLRPDVEVIDFRGNVETRLAKLESGEVDATFLAVAGLKRLGREAEITAAIPVDQMLPAVAQGAIGIEVRTDDAATVNRVAPLNDQSTALCVLAEREFLKVLDGSCRTPIAALATLAGDTIDFQGMVLAKDGSRVYARQVTAPARSAMQIAIDAGTAILEEADPDVLGDH